MSSQEAEICKRTLTSEAFSGCNDILDPMDYIDACVQDLCHCGAENNMPCLCSMFAEYSRQCTHSGGVPGNWRTPEMCPQKCPQNMIYQECGSPCLDTCSNTERSLLCEDHGIDGCFCPPGTVLDDINNSGCIHQEECYCAYNSEMYSPGSSFNIPCRECTCAKGKWKCKELPCTGTCSVESGAHFTSFDGSRFSINLDCTYIFAKHRTHDDFSILVELRRCGIASEKSCLKSVILGLNKGETVLAIKENHQVSLNWIPIQLPMSVANMTIFWSTSFCLNIHTAFGEIQIHFVPVMQAYVTLGPSYHDQTSGLCGNFNNIQSDDFTANSGISEGTVAAFANSWKSAANCPIIKNSYEDPCSLNLEKEKYAQHWCGLLTSPAGPFSPCHSIENPLTYYSNCLSDTCSYEDSEEGLCAALASYAFACAKKSVFLPRWRDNVCEKYTKTCKESQVYQYNVTGCQPSCRSRSHEDAMFNFKFSPVDGCVCKEGTYLNDNGDCVPPNSCPCYYQGNAIQSGEMVEDNGIKCTCERGQMTCMGGFVRVPVCSPPLVYFNCSSAPKGTKGVECQRSCHTLDMDCFSSQCMSGCVCPPGLVSNEKGGCIREQDCPCLHNEATYKPGETISVGCNTCTCKNRRWQCTHKQCLGTCSVYGDGHYITFDNKQFSFSGSCEYILAQDNCGENGGQSSFRVITENVPCGTTGTTCVRNIKFFIGDKEYRLDNEKIEVVKRKHAESIPCHMMRRGMFDILKCDNGVMLLSDKKTTIHLKLTSDFKGKVCGICGNFDDKESNDFTTRSQLAVENLKEFGNSWKTDPKCPDVQVIKDPCAMNPYRKSWALRQCGIITSKVFERCHSQVDPRKFYESCISDSCACDTGGDCECFCTAVALYAQACSENRICIHWRTPTICPIFCDYYNDVGECEWHYKPCGDKCIKTCKNPKGECLHELSGCEGCYPKCPPSRPLFNEDTMKCVAQCGCVDEAGRHYNYGEKVKSSRNCYSW
ncbi:mucin-5B-like [Leptodactylus fuscus]|uniref:mucin-5B-like n=1 Tax=Leptodactylus fuscus TaxID=238119 RepID=UPI003F4EA6B0